MPEVVTVPMAEHLRQFPAIDGLVFTSRERKRVNKNYYNPHIWKPALRVAGVDPTRANCMHALRHFYASIQLEAGTSIRAVAEYLGHSDPGFTLRVAPTSCRRGRTVQERPSTSPSATKRRVLATGAGRQHAEAWMGR